MGLRKKVTILLDVDNVLLNFNKAFRSFMIEELGMELPDDPMVDYYPAQILGLSREWEVKALSAFQESERFERLEALPYAVECLKQLHKAGCSIIAITACGHPGLDMEALTQKRMKNLRDVFGEAVFKKVHIVPAGASKLPYLQQYPKKSFWAEDSVKNAIDGDKIGHRSFVIDWPHNKKDVTELPRIPDLRELTALALQERIRQSRRWGFSRMRKSPAKLKPPAKVFKLHR